MEKREHDVNTFEERHARLGKELNHITRSPEDKKEARGGERKRRKVNHGASRKRSGGREKERRKERTALSG